MATIKSFEDMDAWKKAREISHDIHLLTQSRSFSREYSLKDQILRASGSIMDNIAEGFERGGNKEFIQFLYIAKASAGELRSQLCRALGRSYITKNEFDTIFREVKLISDLIMGFIRYLKNSLLKGDKYNFQPSPKPQTIKL